MLALPRIDPGGERDFCERENWLLSLSGNSSGKVAVAAGNFVLELEFAVALAVLASLEDGVVVVCFSDTVER